jgi:hypothetical protein
VGRAAFQLRRELGLPPGAHPLFDAPVSPRLHLAMFSSALGKPQPDWPRQTVQTGFVFYDRRGAMWNHEDTDISAGEMNEEIVPH